MGSTGSSRFSDYPGSGQGGSSGGSSGTDPCTQAFSCNLEEIEQCEYFTENGGLPARDTQLSIVQRSRLFAVDPDGKTVGALPTRLNYIVNCIADGFTYQGRIIKSSTEPVSTIVADFAPTSR